MVGNILVPLLLSEESMQKGSLILFAGLPTVVFNYMIADRYKLESDRVASIVITVHLLALPLVIWLVPIKLNKS